MSSASCRTLKNQAIVTWLAGNFVLLLKWGILRLLRFSEHGILGVMRTHQDIDKRSLALARAIVARIDADPTRQGLKRAREICAHWLQKDPGPAIREWKRILSQNWERVRAVLLDESENGQWMRQSNPFCGILSPLERWAIYRKFSHEKKSA